MSSVSSSNPSVPCRAYTDGRRAFTNLKSRTQHQSKMFRRAFHRTASRGHLRQVNLPTRTFLPLGLLSDPIARRFSVSLEPEPVAGRDYKTASESARQAKWWPKWYHELFMPNVARPWDQMNFTVRSSSATLLLQLSWRGRPLFKSRQYGWIYRMSRAEGDLEDENRSRRLFFEDGKDALGS